MKVLRVFTTKEAFSIPSSCDLDQEGTLIKFYKDGELILVIQTDHFLWCRLTETNLPEGEAKA